MPFQQCQLKLFDFIVFIYGFLSQVILKLKLCG